jgi:hypothetical protein
VAGRHGKPFSRNDNPSKRLPFRATFGASPRRPWRHSLRFAESLWTVALAALGWL